jgi:hypothetical protein
MSQDYTFAYACLDREFLKAHKEHQHETHEKYEINKLRKYTKGLPATSY